MKYRIRYREMLHPVIEPFDLKGAGFTYNRFQDPQRVSVRLPGSEQPTVYWCMLYTIENATDHEVDFYPQFSLVVPKPAMFLPVGYAVARGNANLLTALDAWLLAEKSKGDIDALYRYWMLGQAAESRKPPRWSVIRDVLHWVDGPARSRATP